MDLTGIAPFELGLPDSHTEFRKEQLEAIDFITESDKRFVGVSAPAGMGKTDLAIALAVATGARTAFLTVTKALQSQYMRLGEGARLVEIKGRGNYTCAYYENLSCKSGPREGCKLADGLGCTYECERSKAKHAQRVVPNYSYWFAVNAFGHGLELTDKESGGCPNPFGLLVCDECFPAGTLVDGKPIETIRAGDFVTSYDETSREFRRARVVSTMSRTTSSLVKVILSNGESIVTTENHPFLVEDGWHPASDLSGRKVLRYNGINGYQEPEVHVLQREDRKINGKVEPSIPVQPEVGIQEVRKDILLQEVWKTAGRESVGKARPDPDHMQSMQEESAARIKSAEGALQEDRPGLLLDTLRQDCYGMGTDEATSNSKVQLVWETSQARHDFEAVRLQEEWESILLDRVRKEGYRECNPDGPDRNTMYGVRNHSGCSTIESSTRESSMLQSPMLQYVGVPPRSGSGSKKAIIGEDEEIESDEEPQDQRKSKDYSKGYGLETSSPGGEWKGADGVSTSAGICARMGYGGSSDLRPSEEWIPDELQTGHSQQGTANWDRSGWILAQFTEISGSGPQERHEADWVRVDRVEIYESTNYEEFRRLCPDGLVYNLEVEATHTYLVNGIVVHNCHLIHGQLASSIGSKLTESEMFELGLTFPKEEETIATWHKWAEDSLTGIQAHLDNETFRLQSTDRHKRHGVRDKVRSLESMVEMVSKIAGMDSEDWVVEMRAGTKQGRIWEFDCVWPGKYAERYLFTGIKKVVLMSATARPVMLRQLGLRPDQFDFREWDRIFPAVNNPTYCWPAISDKKAANGETKVVKLSRKTDEEDWGKVIDNLDQFIDLWGVGKRWKGIIHTGTYEVQRRVLEGSRHAGLMIANTREPDSETSMEAAESFRIAEPPVILTSPSFSVGWDLPEAHWVVIVKLPYPATNTKVMKARDLRDKSYIPSMVMQDLVQGCFRHVRSPVDLGVAVILDGNLPWFLMQYKKSLAPGYWNCPTVWKCPEPPSYWK